MNNCHTFDIVIPLTRIDTPEAVQSTSKKRNGFKCEEVTFTCHYCDKLYFDKKELIKHIEHHMKNENKLKCHLCNIGFSRKTYLTEHYCIHNGEKPHSCYYCGKSFSLRCNLVRHSRIHTGEKRFSCDRCDRKFILKKNLIEHQRTHTGEKPFKCKTCNRPFGRRSSLVRHVRTHTGEKKYICQVCKKTFAWKYYLQRHMPIHMDVNRRISEDGPARRTRKATHTTDPVVIDCSGDKPFICNVCGKLFKTKGGLNKHAKQHVNHTYGFTKQALFVSEELTPEAYEILTTKKLLVCCERVPS